MTTNTESAGPESTHAAPIGTEPEPGSTPPRVLRRSDDRLIAGFCSGLAEYLGVDTTLVRLALLLLVVFGGSGVALYALAWLVVPDARGQIAGVRIATRLGLTRRTPA